MGGMASTHERLRDPVLWSDVSQIVKTVVAAVLAWVIARDVLDIAQPFLAPWAALLTVHATVYRTFARGVQQVGATMLGVLLAFLLDTVIGIGVGLVVNLVVWPPLRDRAAARRVDRIDDRLGELLTDMAARLREGGVDGDAAEWEERTRDIEHDVDLAWATVRQARESGRMNPRRGAAERIRAADDFGTLLTRLEQATAETRSMARTFGGSTGGVPTWDPAFRETWIGLLERTGRAIMAADVEAVETVRADVEAAARSLSGSAGSSLLHPEHGAQLVNLRNIADAMGDVAGAQPVRERAPDPRTLPRRRRAAAGGHRVSL